MDKRRAMRRAVGWLLVAGALVVVAVAVAQKGADWGETKAEWGQVIIQGLAALGGLWFWLLRSRPRVTLRLRLSGIAFLELANTGNRVARQVQVKCDPPLPLPYEKKLGPIVDYGDMDRDQRYVVAIESGPMAAEALSKTAFTVSHERPWGVGRRKSTMRFGSASAVRHVNEDVHTPVGQIAEAFKKQGQKLDKIGRAVESVARRLPSPAEEDKAAS